MALSRVFVGVHYLGDITAGAIEGILIGGLLVFVFRYINYDKKVVESIRIN
ncbi:MAG: hypothetical protein RIF34_00750 [Candidatus Kapaibacterium sp.]